MAKYSAELFGQSQRIGRSLIFSQKINIIFSDLDLGSEKITFSDLDL